MVVVEPEGFAFVGVGDEKVFVSWSAVREVVAYKLDLITTDEVRLRLSLDVSPNSVEVSEEMVGFENFRAAAEERLQFPEGWWAQVLQPAFAINVRLLFSRGELSQIS